MPETTLTVSLGGDVPLDLFADSMQRFRHLIEALTVDVSGTANITWIVDDLASGSAIATIRGEAEQDEDVERVVKAYTVVGKALEHGDIIPFSPRVALAAYRLTSVLDGKITSIRFETREDEATVTAGMVEMLGPAEDHRVAALNYSPAQSRPYFTAYGAIEGRIETLSSRKRLSFTLYDSLNDRAVRCRLQPDQQEMIRDAWDNRVIVEGRIKREPVHGYPIEINPVENITILPEVVPGSYRRARGASPAPSGTPTPENRIRRLRDV